MPKVALPPGVTDEDYVLGLLRATGVLCVYGSGFGTAPEDGFFRVVFLASPAELSDIYDADREFTARVPRTARRVSCRRPARDQNVTDPVRHLDDRARRHPAVGRVPRPRRAAALYVSGLLAIGFSPIVRLIERQKVLPIGRRLPRWLAILSFTSPSSASLDRRSAS